MDISIIPIMWNLNNSAMLDVLIARSINFCVVSGNNNKEMWQFAKHLEKNGYHPIEIIYQWGTEKPRLKVHGDNLVELQKQLTKEVTEWNLKN